MAMRRIGGLALACALVAGSSTGWVSAQGRAGGPVTPEGLVGPGSGRVGAAGVTRDLVYAVVPGRQNDIGYGGVGILVFDAARNFRFVKRIPTWEYTAAQYPENVKGVAVSVPLGLIYVSTIRRIAAFDLTTEKKVWEQTYDGNCCDRMAISPDGTMLYVPSLEKTNWYVVDAKTGAQIKFLPAPASDGAHNTVWSLDGTKVFLAGLRSTTMSIADPKTHTIIQTVGPFANVVRPFTVNGAGTLIYASVNDIIGFQIGDVRTGKVQPPVVVQGYGWSRERITGHGTPSHGVALSPDEKEVWVVDGPNTAVHIFDNTVTPAKQVKSIKVRDSPFWLTWSDNGRWVYASSGDIIDAQSKTIIASLKDELGRDVQGEKVVEVIFQNGKPIKAVDQFGVGRVRGGAASTN
jgi:DNA-binding beta-propeller fold protein YncE